MDETLDMYLKSINKFLNGSRSPYPDSMFYKDKTLDREIDSLFGVVLLTVLSYNAKLIKKRIHGYYTAVGLCMLEKLIKNFEDTRINTIDKIRVLCTTTVSNMYKLVIENLKTVRNYHPQRYEEISTEAIKYLDTIIPKVTSLNTEISFEKKIKHDLVTCDFPQELIDNVKNKKQVKREYLNDWIERYYGGIGELAVGLGWIIGGGCYQDMTLIREIGRSIGWLLKIHSDFNNLEKDMESCEGYSHNYIINYGITDTFEKFIDSKSSLIRNCQIIGVYKKTIEQIHRRVEYVIDREIERCDKDIISTYSSYT